MTPSIETRRADALLQLERTRATWLMRCAKNPSGPDTSAAELDGLAPGGPLNAAISEWLAVEIAARLWPDERADLGDAATSPPPAALGGPATDALRHLTDRHPWLCVLAGLLAGGLAMSQRQRLLRWGIATGLPWLTSQAAVLALPLLAQWLARQPAQEPQAAAETEAQREAAFSAPPNSPAAGSPG